MIKNYLKTAVRSLLRHRFFSAINIFGLAVSMAICMGIIMLVADQLSYDRFNTNRNRVYRVISQIINPDGTVRSNQTATSPQPLADELRTGYTGIEKVARLKRGFANNWFEFGQDINIPISGYFADPEVFEIFQYALEYGDPVTALNEPYTVVITKKASRKLFKEENPVGKTIQVGENGIFTITGVLKETQNKSHIVFDALGSMATVSSLESQGKLDKSKNNWSNYWNTWTYVLLEEDKQPRELEAHFTKIFQKHIEPITNPDILKAKFAAQPMMDITPGPFLNNPIGPFLPWLFVYFLGGLAGLVMLTSCFNFTNLSIARSLTRAREIGIRKVSGAARWQVFTQFISEAVITSLVSLTIGFVIITLLKPLMLQLNFARLLKWDLETNLSVYGVFVVFAILVGILAGFFPAVVLSGFQPVKVLKNISSMKLFSKMGLRKALMVSQFTLSLIFILSVILVYNQLGLFIRADHGFGAENHMTVMLNKTNASALKTELLKHPNVESVSAASHIPAAGTSYGDGFKKSLEDPEWMNFNYFSVDEDYISNLSLNLIAGNNFTAEAGESNKNFMIINEEALKSLGYATPMEAIGQELIYQPDSTKKQIIGVIRNYYHEALMSKLRPMALLYKPDEYSLLQVKYSGSFQDAAASAESAWSVVNPNLKVDYRNMVEEIQALYKIFFGDIVKVVGVVAGLAILISCLGLLGMATYTTETRIKEISIRKVLGSNSFSIVVLLSQGFITLLGLAVAIGVPFAYFINNLWLELIAYHTSVDLTVILIGVSILIVFGVVTIGSQTIRATFVKPVDNLRSE